ncbi:hypothetical protein [Sphingomonas gellani]|nr:hypothetical protein [Sphingomonas gellani]
MVWFAVEMAGSAPHSRSQQQGNAADATGETVTAADLSTIANAMAQ